MDYSKNQKNLNKDHNLMMEIFFINLFGGFDGIIDQIRYYNRALQLKEIKL